MGAMKVTIATQRRCYEMRQGGAKWRDIGNALNPSSTHPLRWAIDSARSYAKSRGLTWPVKLDALRATIGERLYLKRVATGLSWAQCARLIGSDPRSAHGTARHYAQAAGLAWPPGSGQVLNPDAPTRARSSNACNTAYRLRAGGMSWQDIATQMTTSIDNAQNCARYYARSRQLPWPPAPGGTP